MRPRTYRRRNDGSGNRRKTIGAVVVAGVVVAMGVTGLQLASASTDPKAVNLVSVDGQQFDVSKCADVQVNGGAVVCDGEPLAPVEQQAPGDAAAASAAA